MPVVARIVLPAHLSSQNPKLIARTPDLNPHDEYTLLGRIANPPKGAPPKGHPLVHYLDAEDVHPAIAPAPAWYIPSTNDIYIHTALAELTKVPEIDLYQATIGAWADKAGTNRATILGLLSHEAAHAAISDDMDPLVQEFPHYKDLITTLEELRAESHAVRRVPQCRRYLRASMALVLRNLPDEFENDSHVVRAWTLVHGRTLAGVSEPVETLAIDTAARTMLDDDVIDALTDLTQEALTLNLASKRGRKRMIEICDEWTKLVPPPAASAACTHVARSAKKGEKTDEKGGGGKTDEKNDEAAGAGSGDDEGEGSEGDEDGAGTGGGSDDGEAGVEGGGDDPVGEHNWGDPDTEQLDGDSDPAALSDEEAELMRMLTRDAAHLMQEGWNKLTDKVPIANAAEWAAKIFGNNAKSARVVERDPTVEERQAVVAVAGALSNLVLPAITKTARPMVVPPGKLRSREALRAAAERAQGQMVGAKPWRGTVRRHSHSRPLVIGVATDTSGSMSWAERGVASFAYVYANAGNRIGARTAAVTFGDSVHRIARPGEVMRMVGEKSASDGTERFNEAMAALDGVLHLTEPSYAARILFIVSDSALVGSGQPEACGEWMRRMDKAGTHIVWITDAHGGTPFLHDLVVQLPHLVHRKAGFMGYRRHRSASTGDKPQSVFDFLNTEALAAIAHDLHS